MELGAKIKILREQKGMTLEELGNVVGVGKSTVRKWENGMIANMRRDKIAKVAAALDVSPAYLMGWKEEPEENPALMELALQVAQQKRLMAYFKRFQELSQEHQVAVESMIDFLYNEEQKEKDATLNA